MSPRDALMSRNEVAKLLSVSVETVDRRVRDDFQFPSPLRIGRRVLFRSAEIDAYVMARGLAAREAARQKRAVLPHARNASSPYGFKFQCFRRRVA